MAGRKAKIIYGILAVLIYGILAGVFVGKSIWLPGEKTYTDTETEYDMVMLGDSILGRVRDETGIPYQVAAALDITVYNGALGGTCMGRLEQTGYANEMKDVLSLVSLSKSIVTKDFRMQKLVELNENGTEYFAETIEQLSRIDFSKVKLLMLGYGVNDYHAGERIYNEEDPYDEYTYIGALTSSVRMLQNTYPDMRIVLLTSPYTWYTNEGLTCEEYVLGGNVLEDYVDAALEAAEALGVEIIDLYEDVFPHDTWEDWQRYSVDGLHPNEEGRKLLSQIIIEYLEDDE